MNKISKEFIQLSGEELFKPITKRLEKSATEQKKEEVEENPDYAMDEFDRTNPFGDDFRADVPTPAPSPESPPPPTPPPYHDVVGDDGDDGDFPPPPPPLVEVTSMRKTWEKPGSPKYDFPHESTLLQTFNQLITRYGNDPLYRVKSKTSPLCGYSVEDLKKRRDEIYEKRRPTQSLSKQIQERKHRLKPTPLRKSLKSPASPLEKAVMSRRPVVEPSDDEEDFPEQDWETEGSGFAGGAEAEELMDQLFVSLGSSELETVQ